MGGTSSVKIEELTDKLYREGIEKANTEAESVLDGARKQADALLAEAKKQSESIIKSAHDEAEKQKARSRSELPLAANQAVATLKSRIIELLTESTLSACAQRRV